jgi:hypothetical protein
MSKPTVFISHSSKDEPVLRQLKQKLNDKLGGTVDIFLSSDGQSIPLGKNWVHRVEKALGDAKLMIVFLSPSSINSNWIYFEAGFSYSKEIRVVPVAILGVDLAKISAPLSLLQGFNIINADGLNNIIALINTTFDFSHKETFNEDDFNGIFRLSNLRTGSALGEYTTLVNIITIQYNNVKAKNISEILSLLEKNKIDHQTNNDVVYTHGLEIQLRTDNSTIFARVDPILSNITFPVIDCAVLEFLDDKSVMEMKVFFNSWVNYVSDSPKLTARFYGSEISLGKSGVFLYKDLSLSLHRDIRPRTGNEYRFGPAYLDIKCAPKNLPAIPLPQLLTLLLEREAIYIEHDQNSG